MIVQEEPTDIKNNKLTQQEKKTLTEEEGVTENKTNMDNGKWKIILINMI